MRFAEPVAALRRIPAYLVDEFGAGVTGVVPTGAELRVSKSGAALGNAGGTWAEVGSGFYYYEATLAEVTTASYLLLRVAVTGVRPYVFATDIGDRIPVGALAPARRIPLYLVDASGDPVAGLTFQADDVQLSLDGATFVEGAGTFGESGDGAYFYELAATELVEGPGLLRFEDQEGESVQVYVYTWDVRPAGVALAAVPDPIEAPAITDGNVPTIDHVTAALARLPHQYRGTSGR